MNVATQLCGLSILLIILFFYCRSPKVGFRSSRWFLALLVSQLVTIYFDLSSLYGIRFANRLTPFATSLFCRLYLVGIVITTYIGFCYIQSYAAIEQRRILKLRVAFSFIMDAGVILSLALPIYWHMQGIYAYTSGPACVAAFIVAPFFMLATVVFSIIYRKDFKANVIPTVIVWIGFEAVASIIQSMNNSILIISFATTVGLLVIFFELENPALQMDYTTGVFNLSTLTRYVRDIYNDDQKFSFLIVKLVYEGSQSAASEDSLFIRTANLLKRQSAAKVFFSGQASFVLIYRNVSEAEAGAQFINSEMADLCRNTGSGFLEIYEPEGRKARSVMEIIELTGELSVNGEYSDRRIITLHDDDYKRFRQQREVIKEIDRALDEDRVEAYFQPIYCFAEEKFTVAEALVRIRKEDGSILPPGLFIPVAEKTGQVTKIGDRMFEKTLALFKDEKVHDMGVNFIDVNLSVLQCEDPTLATRYLSLMRKAGVSPSRFCFEITESAMIVNRDTLLSNMNAFREAGSSVSLDDFGNGESNLNYVIDMPIDLIKADRSMVSNYRMNHRVGLIMDSMIHMAKGLSLKIVAEGVETEDDLKAMKDLDIDYIQGFYFSKPLPRDEYVKFVKKNNLKSA